MFWIIIMRLLKTNASMFTALIVMGAHCYLFYIFTTYWLENTSAKTKYPLVLPYVVVHIDLKGAPPKLNYLKSMLPMLKEHGVNGLLMEYEDMFPYDGTILNISAKNCYGKAELHHFLNKAKVLGFEIIPLIQTFGHLEHALKLEEFVHIREDPPYPDSICPSKSQSRVLITEMLTQVINFHNNISKLKHIHIGCDEVFHVNKCDDCQKRNLPILNVFVNHVKSISDIVKTLSSDTNILIWHDMLREINSLQWSITELIPDIELVYWDYSPSISVSHIQLLQYHRRFKNKWIASAYKGADGQTATVPDLKSRFMNHFSWLSFILGYKFGGETQVYNFKGIILTGWSRYSHMQPLCELLPASVPSLILNLLLIKKFKTEPIARVSDPIYDYEHVFSKHLVKELNRSLQCSISMDLDNFDSSMCSFESYELYASLTQLSEIHKDVISKLFNEANYLMAAKSYSITNRMSKNEYNKHVTWINSTLCELQDTEVQLRYHMRRYFENDVIKEYLDYKTNCDKEFLFALMSILEKYQHNYVWTRNPPNFTPITAINESKCLTNVSRFCF